MSHEERLPRYFSEGIVEIDNHEDVWVKVLGEGVTVDKGSILFKNSLFEENQCF